MPERYVAAILKYMSDREYQPLKPKQLARWMGVDDDAFSTFRASVKRLRDAGQVVMGTGNALMLPEMPGRITGFFRQNPKGFGFVTPESPNSNGDLFIPPDAVGGAMDGDLVIAEARKQGKRDGQTLYRGKIVKIVKRSENRVVGELKQSEGKWFVLPDGKQLTQPIIIRDVGAAGAKTDTKVVVEITKYPEPGQLPVGVIVEEIGPAGPLATETRAVIIAHGLAEEFPQAALDEARAAVAAFDPEDAAGREDLTSTTIITIDPDTARDYDDAISIEINPDGTWTTGVHIADVSHFVPEGGELDASARSRATSVYFPRRVLPMLPEVLSNGVCSLQEGVKRFCKSAFITYDQDAKVVNTRVAETVICSTKRLTYEQAQDICDGKNDGFAPEVVELVGNMLTLARKIQARRADGGMLRLDLHDVELVLDDQDRVIDVEPEDDAYTHTIIEMFMVEANEAVARLFDSLNRPVIRRVHPSPDKQGSAKFKTFVRAAGHKVPGNLTVKDMQDLLAKVRGKPESKAVNLALLKTMQRAEYSPMQIGHFALASDAYCHFTSPIRRYPDLTVHRMVAEHCRGNLKTRPPEDVSALVTLAEACTAASERADAAEKELTQILVLQLLSTHLGEIHDGVVDGISNFGIFVELPKYGIDGLIRLEDLGDDWWEVSTKTGKVFGERSGRVFRIGDPLRVKIVAVDVAARQLNLVPEKTEAPRKKKRKDSAKSKGKGKAKGKTKAKMKKKSRGGRRR
ncbi:MAG: ribonuclease R [Phycisphaerales bacterium]|jgi:ribonuclease R|nr:ribonuclease R [Phycisphaerales bacterium]